MIDKLEGQKNPAIWKPRLTRETIRFAAKDPEASPQNAAVTSVTEGCSILFLDEVHQLQAVSRAVSDL